MGDPEFFSTDPYPVLASLREECPVDLNPETGFWTVTRYRDIQAIGKDPRRFCSGEGVLISDKGRQVAATDSLLYLDPPVHELHRKLVSRAFTPRRVASLEPRISELTKELLDKVDPSSRVDIVDAVTAPLPLLVIAELLGLPPRDRDDFRRWSDAIMEAASEITEENALLALELLSYFESQIDQRKKSPTDDLLGALLDAEVDGRHLSREELLGFCMTLLVAGNETTRSLMTGGIVALGQHSDQRSMLANDLGLIPQAVEEMLRWVTPIMAMARTTTEPVSVGDQRLGEGEYVVLAYASGNRDEEIFSKSANVFDITRTPNPHLSFGFGEHFCIGAGLARLETRVLMKELLTRWPEYEVQDVERVPSTLLSQISRATIVFDPTRP